MGVSAQSKRGGAPPTRPHGLVAWLWSALWSVASSAPGVDNQLVSCWGGDGAGGGNSGGSAGGDDDGGGYGRGGDDGR